MDLGGEVSSFYRHASLNNVWKCLARRCVTPPALFLLIRITYASTSNYVGTPSLIWNGEMWAGTGRPRGDGYYY